MANPSLSISWHGHQAMLFERCHIGETFTKFKCGFFVVTHFHEDSSYQAEFVHDGVRINAGCVSDEPEGALDSLMKIISDTDD